jgi:formate dehydrogenase major subunit
MSTIKFTLDGKTVEAQPGETILAVATRNGVDIPSLCFSQKVSKTTSCFVCVVKDCKTGRFLPSCSACPSEGQQIEASSDEVLDMRRTALGLLVSEHNGDCEAPCTLSCPAHASVEEYVRAGRQGDFLKALKIIKERIPLPMSIGRVCPRFCEKDCRRNVAGKPVAINEFKRLSADLFYESYMEELPPLGSKRVAVVGGGPAGLSCAYYLRRQGVKAVVFEAQPEAGGMLRYGIPEFRLPKKILRKELAHFKKIGVEIECGKTLGKDVHLDDLRKDFDAVAITVGSWEPSSMRIEGEDFAQQGIRWLHGVASANWTGLPNPGRTIVVGGGNTAMDCARTALRLGGSVSVVYRRTQDEMPAEQIEVHEAMEEGVRFEFLTAPLALKKLADGSLSLSCQKMKLGDPDASGRRSPMPVPGSEFEIPADTVIAAIGQRTASPKGLKATKRGDVEVGKADNRCGVDGNVFAAGDCVSGPATVVEAVAGGRKIALAICDSFEGRPHVEPPLFNVSRGHWRSLAKEDIVKLREISDVERIQPHFISAEARKSSFEELFPTFSEGEVKAEGERCIECSCTAKGDCLLKKRSQEYGVKADDFKGERVVETADVRHPYIVHDRMKCVKCGICVKVCSEVVNKNLLAFKSRGFHTSVGTAFDAGLPSYCEDCGKCIEECPVGALDWKAKP